MRRINLRSISVRFNTITTILVLALLAGFGTYNYIASTAEEQTAVADEINQSLTRIVEVAEQAAQ